MKKLILSSLLFVSLIGVGAGAYIINGSYSPLNTAINVELGDKFGYEIVLDSNSLAESMNNINTNISFNPCNDKSFVIKTVTTEDTTSPTLVFGMLKNFTSIDGNSTDDLEVKSIEVDLVDDTLADLSSYVLINNFTESTVGYFVPTNGVVTSFSIDTLQTLQVNSIIITLGI